MPFKLQDLKTNLISRFYPLSKREIIKNKYKLNFDRYYLMANDHVVWDEELLDYCKKELDWTAIWKLSKINLSIEFYKKHEALIDFSSIHLSKNFILTEDILNLYGVRFNKVWLVLKLGDNQLDFINQHKEDLDWNKLSRSFDFKQSDEIVTKYEELWNWDKLSSNRSLPINEGFIDKFKEKLNFKNLSRNPSFFHTILENPNYEKWHWLYFIFNPELEWNTEMEEFLKQRLESEMHPHFKKFDFVYNRIIRIYLLFNDNRVNYFLTDKYLKHISFEDLNKSRIKTNPIFFNKHKDKLDLSNSLLTKYNKDMISMKYILNNTEMFDNQYGTVTSLNINQDFLDKYPFKISWFDLSKNIFFDWDWEFVKENIEHLNLFQTSQNKAVYDCFMKSVGNTPLK